MSDINACETNERLEDVPERDDWVANPNSSPGIQDEPVFIPKEPIQPHIIEKVVVLQSESSADETVWGLVANA